MWCAFQSDFQPKAYSLHPGHCCSYVIFAWVWGKTRGKNDAERTLRAGRGRASQKLGASPKGMFDARWLLFGRQSLPSKLRSLCTSCMRWSDIVSGDCARANRKWLIFDGFLPSLFCRDDRTTEQNFLCFSVDFVCIDTKRAQKIVTKNWKLLPFFIKATTIRHWSSTTTTATKKKSSTMKPCSTCPSRTNPSVRSIARLRHSSCSVVATSFRSTFKRVRWRSFSSASLRPPKPTQPWIPCQTPVRPSKVLQ